MTIDQLTESVIGMAMEIHRLMGPGYNESIYHRSLEVELAAANIPFESEVPINVFYKGKIVGKFEADMVITIGKQLLIELKSCETIVKAHEAQTVNYLTATGIDDGLILNFGAPSLQFKRKFRLYRPRQSSNDPFDIQ
ncbi:GxxExxY protein [Prosthecobacter fusiformis]|uniref:GxxExxY protein n=1 Tax=Prosthecobacter fusiformis TaxID=48464 RepID=A0A4R7RUL4_9BACT|nr:GxxExxY protein [Prosthecobacter fusiformis]TDU69390.1 GxxExxY protein [Prosthecobacter fusiformis]